MKGPSVGKNHVCVNGATRSPKVGPDLSGNGCQLRLKQISSDPTRIERAVGTLCCSSAAFGELNFDFDQWKTAHLRGRRAVPRKERRFPFWPVNRCILKSATSPTTKLIIGSPTRRDALRRGTREGCPRGRLVARQPNAMEDPDLGPRGCNRVDLDAVVLAFLIYSLPPCHHRWIR